MSIQRLPEHIVNKIAAGEVVQRPASVLKELVENSLDAGASSIKVLLKDQGSTLIQVIDNGCGIAEDELTTAFERHATSKLRAFADLETILTLGFRGEALASIAAVSRVSVKTRTAGSALGTHGTIEGGRVVSVEPVATPVGTNFAVKDLFYNVPARRHFLKSASTEFRHCLDSFTYLALSRLDVRFELYSNGKEVYNLPNTTRDLNGLEDRISRLFQGKPVSKWIPVSAEEGGVQLDGLICHPSEDIARRSRGTFFVNGRWIQQRYFDHAVRTAYGSLLTEKQGIYFALSLTVDPRHVDVNVHPTKAEVSFDDESGVYGFIQRSIRSAIAQGLGMPNISTPDPSRPFWEQQTASQPTRDSSAWNPSEYQKGEDRSSQTSGSVPRGVGLSLSDLLYSPEPVNANIPEDSREKTSQDALFDEGDVSRYGPIWYHASLPFLFFSSEHGLMVGHLVRIMAKLLYEGVALPDGLIPTATQEDLFGATLHVTSTVYRWVEDHQDELAERSISLSPLGGNTLSVSGLPSHLNLAALQAHLEEVVSQSGPQGNRDNDAQLWDLCQRRARAAVANGLNPAMVSTIVVALHRTTLPHFTPSGGLTMVPYAVEEINRRFNRRVDDPR